MPRPGDTFRKGAPKGSNWAESLGDLSAHCQMDHTILSNREHLRTGSNFSGKEAIRNQWPSTTEFSTATPEPSVVCVETLLLRTLADHQREMEAYLESKHARLKEAVIEACKTSCLQAQSTRPLEAKEGATSHPSHMDSTLVLAPEASELPKSSSKIENETRHHIIHRNDSSHFRTGSLRSRLDHLLRGNVDTVIGVLIVLNTAVMFVELQVYGSRGIPEPPETHEIGQPAKPFGILTHAFSGIFLLELLIKLYTYRLEFLHSALNVLDILVVMVTSADAWVLPYVGTDLVNVSFLRVFRFVRMARALRVMRTLSLFSNLRVLVNAIFLSVSSLFWSCLVLFVFIFASSLFLCQTLQDFVYDTSGDYDDRVWVDRYYGTSSKALYTVFEMTLSGCWPNYARRLIEKVNPWYAAFFSLYVTVVVFSILKIVAALFLKNTLTSAAEDDEMVLDQRMEEISRSKVKLRELFQQADKSGDGVLSLEELDELLGYPKVKTLFGMLGLNTYSAMELFDLLDDGDGVISYHEFIDGITRMQGNARSQDLLLIIRNSDAILEQCEFLQTMCRSMQTALGLPIQSPPSHRRRRFGTHKFKKELTEGRL